MPHQAVNLIYQEVTIKCFMPNRILHTYHIDHLIPYVLHQGKQGIATEIQQQSPLILDGSIKEARCLLLNGLVYFIITDTVLL